MTADPFGIGARIRSFSMQMLLVAESSHQSAWPWIVSSVLQLATIGSPGKRMSELLSATCQKRVKSFYSFLNQDEHLLEFITIQEISTLSQPKDRPINSSILNPICRLLYKSKTLTAFSSTKRGLLRGRQNVLLTVKQECHIVYQRAHST